MSGAAFGLYLLLDFVFDKGDTFLPIKYFQTKGTENTMRITCK